MVDFYPNESALLVLIPSPIRTLTPSSEQNLAQSHNLSKPVPAIRLVRPGVKANWLTKYAP